MLYFKCLLYNFTKRSVLITIIYSLALTPVHTLTELPRPINSSRNSLFNCRTWRSQHWIICVNVGVLRTNIHDILSEGCLVLLQEVLWPQGSNQTVSPLHNLTSPSFTCSGRGGGQRSRTVWTAWSSLRIFSRLSSSWTSSSICQLALHEVQGSKGCFGMPWLGCRSAAGA